ncbi:MAG: diaminopimelate epimerase [Magnetococcus sp. MYC-9]
MSASCTMEMIQCHGTRNDFIILDECRGERIAEPFKAPLARLLADRAQGIGSDGVIFLSQGDARQPRMRFFNPDGSEAEMCGNGLRCASRACFEGNYAGQNPLVFQTLGGLFQTENFFSPEHQLPFVRMTTEVISTNPEKILADRSRTPFLSRPIRLGEREWTGSILSVGNPHLIVPVADLAQVALMEVGPALEQHPMFLNRANVSFVQKLDQRTILVQTYERGAGLTLSCGTGMTASVVALVLNGTLEAQQPVAVHTAGGIVWVAVQVSGERIVAQLTGNATWICKGTLSLRLGEDGVRFAGPERVLIGQRYADEAARFAQLARQSRFDPALLRGTPLEQAGRRALV